MIVTLLNRRLDRPLGRLLRPLCRWGLTPNLLSVAGLALNLAAAALLANGEFLKGGLLILVAGCFDFLDGIMARALGLQTPFGAFLDSVVDRYSDMALFTGLLLHYAAAGQVGLVGLGAAALVGAILTSYTRARAELLGIRCDRGLGRPERILLLAAGALFDVMPAFLGILAVLGHGTALWRIAITWVGARRKMAAAGSPAAASLPRWVEEARR
ncbi:MAG: CDP-alcohol phosphatidyltransferase family protein [Deltaproteobacteria bacterium]|nr:CDP-alcohol phosphatidyltransferase family protein [Deltaproteobacteria bacterium]MBI3076136.1 CDP-alcohol phosphatidyltransferase family protein [Deltaproteobacteria bacterium]